MTEGLRVADASIFPSLPSVNPCLTCMMVGERAAELIAADLHLTVSQPLNGMSRLPPSDEELRAFLAEPLLAVIGTARRDGTVALNVVWFEHRDDELWLNSYTSAQWPKRLVRERRATVLIVDPTDMLRRAQLVCALVSVSSEGARDHIDRLAVRYLGTGYAGPHEEPLIVRLAPERVFGEINRPRAAGSDRETTR